MKKDNKKVILTLSDYHTLKNIKKFHLVEPTLLETIEEILIQLETNMPEIVIFDESALFHLEFQNLFLLIRLRFPSIRIIYILNEEDFFKRLNRIEWGVFDILLKEEIEKVEETILCPKTFEDVKKEVINFPKEVHEFTRNRIDDSSN